MPNIVDDIKMDEWGYLWINATSGTHVSESLTYIRGILP
jgi:hypothetical protein